MPAKHSSNSHNTRNSSANGNTTKPPRIDDEEALAVLATNTDSASQSDDDQFEDQEEEEEEEEEITSFRTPDLSWRDFFLQDIANNRFLELQLILLTFATGILDSMTFSEVRIESLQPPLDSAAKRLTRA